MRCRAFTGLGVRRRDARLRDRFQGEREPRRGYRGFTTLVSRRARAECQISRVRTGLVRTIETCVSKTGFKASESRGADIAGSQHRFQGEREPSGRYRGFTRDWCAPSRRACPRPVSRRARAEAQISRVHNTGFKASESRVAEGTTRARYAAEQRRAAGRNKYGHLAARRLTAVAAQGVGVAAADGGAVGQNYRDAALPFWICAWHHSIPEHTGAKK